MYYRFYSASAMASRFPLRGKRDRTQWAIYNLFMRAASRTVKIGDVTETPEPAFAPMPPILPVKREWRAAVLEAAKEPETRATLPTSACT